MRVDQALIGAPLPNKRFDAAEVVDRERRPSLLQLEPEQDEKKVAPEEILTRIKALTEEGNYSVRFEMDAELNQLVVRVVDQDSGEQVRQIPSEEILGTSKRLHELRGVLLNTES